MKILRGGSENFYTPERGALRKFKGGSEKTNRKRGKGS